MTKLLLLLLGLVLLLLLWMLLHDSVAAVRRYYRRFAQAVYEAVCSLSVNRSAAVARVQGMMLASVILWLTHAQ